MTDIISDTQLMTVLGRQMARAVERQAVAAGNLANLDTPGYKTRDLSFHSALEERLETLPLTETHTAHLGAPASTAGGTVQEVEGLAVRRDGNNVQLDRELLSIGRASADFSAAQALLSAKFHLVRYAINEGR